MSSSIQILLDASNSMNDSFGGLEELSKFDAATEAFRIFFENTSKKPRQYNEANRNKLGVISYRTNFCNKPICEEVYPLRFFPPVPDIDDLKKIKPNGDSPLFEAIEKGIENLTSQRTDNKIMVIVTGDSLSNCSIKTNQIDGIVAKIKTANIFVSILQSGYADKDGFKLLVEKLRPVALKNTTAEPRIAQSVRVMKEWLEALF
jgi:hypothetical protein